MHIQYAHKSSTLSAIIVQAQQLEARIILGSQVALQIILICQGLQLAAGMKELLCLTRHSVISQQIRKDFEVAGLIGSRVLRNLLEIWEGAPLSHLVGHSRLVHIKGNRRSSLLNHTNHIPIEVVFRLRSLLVPIQSARTTLYMILALRVPSPTATNGCTTIYTSLIACFLPFFHKVAYPFHPVSRRFIARSKHAEARMIAIFLNHSLSFLHQIMVDGHAIAQLYTMVWPRWTFGLKIDSHLIGCRESCLGRTIRMESHHIESIFLAFLKNTEPRSLIGWRITRLRETAVAHRSSHPNLLAIHIKLSTFDGNLTHTKGSAKRFLAQSSSQGIKIRMEFIPKPDILAHRNNDGEFSITFSLYFRKRMLDATYIKLEISLLGIPRHIHHHLNLLALYIRINLQVADILLLMRLQFHFSDDAVPVALGLVGYAMRILTHAYIFYAIIHLDADFIILAIYNIRCNIKLMRHTQRRIPARQLAVDINRSLYMRTFQIEDNSLLLPLLRHKHRFAIPRIADVMLLWGEEERKLHGSLDAMLPIRQHFLLAIFLHIRIEIEGRIIKTSCPLRMGTDIITLAVGEHRTRQLDHILIGRRISLRESPLPREVYSVIRADALCLQGSTSHQAHHQNNISH